MFVSSLDNSDLEISFWNPGNVKDLDVVTGVRFHEKSLHIWFAGVERQVSEQLGEGGDGHLGRRHL